MILTMLKSKIHQAVITQCDLHYEGSITVAEDILEQSNILPYEQVDVLNISNGNRFTTYAIIGERGSGIIGINGAAARLAQAGDQIIICAYTRMEEAEAKEFMPTVLVMNSDNSIKSSPPSLKEVVK